MVTAGYWKRAWAPLLLACLVGALVSLLLNLKVEMTETHETRMKVIEHCLDDQEHVMILLVVDGDVSFDVHRLVDHEGKPKPCMESGETMILDLDNSS